MRRGRGSEEREKGRRGRGSEERERGRRGRGSKERWGSVDVGVHV